MKLPRISKKYPLVAIILIAIALFSAVNTATAAKQTLRVMNSDEGLVYSADHEPESVVMGETDYLRIHSVPRVQTLRPFYENWIDKKSSTRKIDEDTLGESREGKTSESPFYLEIGDTTYKQDLVATNGIEPIKKNRNLAIITSYAPSILLSSCVSIVSLCITIALISSYKRGYLVKRNIVFLRICSVFITVAAITPFIAKGSYLYVESGGFITSDQDFPFPWWDFFQFAVIPVLLIVGAITGIAHTVIEHVRGSLSMKEELDGTI